MLCVACVTVPDMDHALHARILIDTQTALGVMGPAPFILTKRAKKLIEKCMTHFHPTSDTRKHVWHAPVMDTSIHTNYNTNTKHNERRFQPNILSTD